MLSAGCASGVGFNYDPTIESPIRCSLPGICLTFIWHSCCNNFAARKVGFIAGQIQIVLNFFVGSLLSHLQGFLMRGQKLETHIRKLYDSTQTPAKLGNNSYVNTPSRIGGDNGAMPREHQLKRS